MIGFRVKRRVDVSLRFHLAVILSAILSSTSPAETGLGAPRPMPGDPVNYVEWLARNRADRSAQHPAAKCAQAARRLEACSDAAALEQACGGPWKDLPVLDSWLAANRATLDAVATAAMVQQSFTGSGLGLSAGRTTPGGPRWQAVLTHATVPDLAAVELATKGLLAFGWRRWSEGDVNMILDRAVAGLAVAHHLEGEVPTAVRIRALNAAGRSYLAIQNALFRHADPPSAATALVERLESYDPPFGGVVACVEFERVTAWDFLQRAYRPGESAGSWMLDSSTAEVYGAVAAWMPASTPSWDAVRNEAVDLGFDAGVAEADDYFDRVRAWGELPYPQASPRLADLAAAGRALRHPFVRLLAADTTAPVQLLTRVTTLQRGTHLIAHVLTFHRAKGRYPESLTDLPGSTLQAHRLDPYSGRDFVYARTQTSFVLYSVGSDGKDDGARRYLPGTEAGDLVIWPVDR